MVNQASLGRLKPRLLVAPLLDWKSSCGPLGPDVEGRFVVGSLLDVNEVWGRYAPRRKRFFAPFGRREKMNPSPVVGKRVRTTVVRRREAAPPQPTPRRNIRSNEQPNAHDLRFTTNYIANYIIHGKREVGKRAVTAGCSIREARPLYMEPSSPFHFVHITTWEQWLNRSPTFRG